MGKKIHIRARNNAESFIERVPAESMLCFLYGEKTSWLRALLCKFSFLSKLYGSFNRCFLSRYFVQPFIEKYEVDSSEFQKKTFSSFSDFFTRKLKKEARPIDQSLIVMPCDGRYLVYEDASQVQTIFVKNQMFSLKELFQDEKLAQRFTKGSLMLTRLAPVDYHRFHLPADCIIEKITPIKGHLFSVNPIALRQNIRYLCENKRVLVELNSTQIGRFVMVVIGATYVGSIHFTKKEASSGHKGEELGYFDLGGSMIVSVFPEKKIAWDQEILKNTQEGVETLGYMGSFLGNLA